MRGDVLIGGGSEARRLRTRRLEAGGIRIGLLA
jgi:hypothetical protein